MRSQFYSQLQKLNNELISMGEAIEKAIYLATQSLIKKDIEKAN